jgi:tetratricopeptide (TPR) repeat protein
MAAPPAQLLADHLFAAPAQRIDVDQVFALNADMHRYLDTVVRPLARRVGMQQALVDTLYTRSQLQLDYDTTRTRTAAEAFAARSGNCLSLLIMTGAFAQELGLNVRFQAVRTDEAWDRSDDLHFFIGHVNIALGQWNPRNASSQQEWMTIDFLPGQDLKRQRVREIDKARVLAMYMNNRAAEALTLGQVDEAYAWVREALRQDSAFGAAYNTLGVVYMRRGAMAQAEQALRFVRGLEPANPHVLGNLGLAVQRQGREAEAQGLFAELRRLQPNAPFELFKQGQRAMLAGDYLAARRLFEQEIARAPDYHEFHFWLALAHLRLGEQRDAQRHMQQALEYSTTREQQGIYSAKLHRMQGRL